MLKVVKFVVIGCLLSSPVFAYGSGGCDSQTTLLCHMDSGTTTFTDEGCNGTGAKTITNNGSVASSSTKTKFGPYSAQFDGTTKYLTISEASGFDFSGDFTVDCWINTADKTADTQLREIWNNGGTSAGASWMGIVIDSTTGVLELITADIIRITGTTNVSDGLWHHVQLSRKGTAVKLFIDGSQEGSTFTSSQDFTHTLNSITIGIYSDSLTTGRWDGYIDEFRVSIGVARNNNLNFSVPTTPYCSGCEMMGILN